MHSKRFETDRNLSIWALMENIQLLFEFVKLLHNNVDVRFLYQTPYALPSHRKDFTPKIEHWDTDEEIKLNV